MKRAIVLFMLAAVAGLFLAPAADAAYDGTFPVRAVSYNIRCYGAWETDSTNKWVNRSADLINLVKNIDADVIGFQEVDPEQMSELKSSLKDYEIIGKHREADNTQRATPVAYRKSRFTKIDGGTFWLSTTPNVQGSKDLGDGYISSDPETCSWVVLKDKATGGVFSFMCTHLDWLNAELRRRNMAILLSKVDALLTAGIPTVVVGDMNAKETEECILAATAVLQDSLLASKTTPTGPWRTYNAWTWKTGEVSNADALANYSAQERSNNESILGGKRIDFIFSSFGTEVEAFATRNDARPGTEYYPSDHYPIVADLRMSCANSLYQGKVRVEIDRSVQSVKGGRYVLTQGAKLPNANNLEFVLPDWVERATVEDGEIVIYTKPEPFSLRVR